MSLQNKKLPILIGALSLLVGGGLFFDSRAILIRSWESKTTGDAPVFNQISFFPGLKRDVWMMNQSHHGLSAPCSQWDRLAIVVDKTVFPRKAFFYELEPGKLRWNSGNPGDTTVPLKASCGLCHSNGPRAIRPDPNWSNSAWDRSRLFLWNLRIKTYGRTESETPSHGFPGTVSFKYAGVFENETLKVKTCVQCHNDHAWVRAPLTRQNFLPIAFMTRNHLMPPAGFHLPPDERAQIAAFVRGFPVIKD